MQLFFLKYPSFILIWRVRKPYRMCCCCCDGPLFHRVTSSFPLCQVNYFRFRLLSPLLLVVHKYVIVGLSFVRKKNPKHPGCYMFLFNICILLIQIWLFFWYDRKINFHLWSYSRSKGRPDVFTACLKDCVCVTHYIVLNKNELWRTAMTKPRKSWSCWITISWLIHLDGPNVRTKIPSEITGVPD